MEKDRSIPFEHCIIVLARFILIDNAVDRESVTQLNTNGKWIPAKSKEFIIIFFSLLFRRPWLVLPSYPFGISVTVFPPFVFGQVSLHLQLSSRFVIDH